MRRIANRQSLRLLVLSLISLVVFSVPGMQSAGAQTAPAGSVWGWGENGQGQLGNGSTIDTDVPAQTEALSAAMEVDGGADHSVALEDDGTVWTWGSNVHGQLGDGTTVTRRSPVRVEGLSGVVDVEAGDAYSLALRGDGTVWAWGTNDDGQLGNGSSDCFADYQDGLVPARVQNLTGVASLAAGDDHNLAVLEDGTVRAWGDNFHDQLGDGTSVYCRDVPVRVEGLTSVESLAARNGHSVALKDDGSVWAWGYNFYGQLGDGTYTDRPTPVRVGGLGRVGEISAGYFHTTSLAEDGSVWTWGRNWEGQLGTGDGESHPSPIRVGDLAGIASIATGAQFNLALGTDGRLWGWGEDLRGQVGDGRCPPNEWFCTHVPRQVSNLTNVTAVGAGDEHGLAITLPDRTPPAAPTITSPANNSYDADGSVTLTGRAEAGSTVEIREGATVRGTATASPTGTWSEALAGVPDGPHTYTARATDAAGNVSEASAARRVIVDTAKPVVGGMSPKHRSTTSDRTPQVKATVKDTLTNLSKGNIKLWVGGKAVRSSKFSYSVRTDGLVYKSPQLRTGKVAIKVVAEDAAGNTATKSWYFTIRR